MNNLNNQKNKIYSVNDINTYISKIIDNDTNLINITIKGEISNLTKHSNGMYYLILKDEKSLLKCLIFKNDVMNLKLDLKIGMNIFATGIIKGYANNGSYSFWIKKIKLSILNEGKGDIFLRYEKLKQYYNSKGYFDKSIKKSIPKFPKNIGIITAPTGAAIKDIISTINRRYNIVNVFLFPCVVQGINASIDIAKNIIFANQFDIKLDVIILGRGGGSFEDLNCFSHPDVIEEIYKSKIPIISAVGHEIDFQISDFVADKRAATPTSAAELCTPDKIELQNFLKQNYVLMKKIIIKKIKNYDKTLSFYKENYHLVNSNWIYKEKEQKLIELKNKLIINFNNIYKLKLFEITNLKNNLELVNPKNILSRGYSIIKIKNKIIKNIDDVKLNDKLNIILKDGYLESQITNIKKDN